MRRSPRIPFEVPVQILFAGEVGAARSRSLSAFGMLLETDCPLPQRARIHLHFSLSAGVGITTAARVVHVHRDRSYGLEFLDMESSTLEVLKQAVQVQNIHARRSVRIPERLFVTLGWQGEQVSRRQVAETVLLSRHGCLLLSKVAPPADACLQLCWPEKQAEIAARVVSAESDNNGLFRVALEFTDDADFWGIDWQAPAEREQA